MDLNITTVSLEYMQLSYLSVSPALTFYMIILSCALYGFGT